MFRQLLILFVTAASMASATYADLAARQGTSSTTTSTTSTTSTSSSTTSSTSTTTTTTSTTTTTTTPGSSSSSSSSSSTSTSTSTQAPPAPTTVRLHPNFRYKKCLDVRGNVQANGTPVQIYDCNGTGAQNWVINFGQTQVQLAGTNFCLDAGTNPASGVGMKIWQCYLGLTQQTWYYTDDSRIAVFGRGQCLDLTDGRLTNANRVQTWKCTDFNTNQIWNI